MSSKARKRVNAAMRERVAAARKSRLAAAVSSVAQKLGMAVVPREYLMRSYH